MTWIMLTPGVGGGASSTQTSQTVIGGRIVPKGKSESPTKTIRNDVGQAKQELPIISLWLNHC